MKISGNALFLIFALSFLLSSCSGESQQEKKFGPKITQAESVSNPLSGLTEAQSQTPFCGIGTINGKKVSDENLVEKANFIKIQGWAIDPGAQKLASKVFVSLNGRLYSSTYGRLRKNIADRFNNPEFEKSGYVSMIPLQDFNQEANEVTVKVVSADGKSYYSWNKTIIIRLQ